MQCPVCHNEVGPQNSFCNHCGASLTAAAPSAAPPEVAYTATPGYSQVPPSYPPPPSGYAVPPPGAASTGMSESSAAALSYVTFIPAVIFLAMEPYNKMPLVRFHSFQSIGLTVVWFALWVAITILQIFLHILPGFFLITMLFSLLHLVLGLGMFILWLMAILKASKGEFYKLPFIGDFAMKQAQS